MSVSNLKQECVAAALECQLQQLRDIGAHHFDPAQFRYIEAMARRARDQREAVNKLVQQRALGALEQYRLRFSSAQNAAANALADGLSRFPQAAVQLQQHFDRSNFSALSLLLVRLQHDKTTQPLADLAAYIARSGSADEPQQRSLSFDDILRQAEQQLLSTGAEGNANSFNAAAQAQADEFNSIHYFRESLVRRNADKRVTRAIREIPEGAGPLNSQKLIVQSLASMRDLSPHYLNRFVAYIDTLLWLERAGAK